MRGNSDASAKDQSRNDALDCMSSAGAVRDHKHLKSHRSQRGATITTSAQPPRCCGELACFHLSYQITVDPWKTRRQPRSRRAGTMDTRPCSPRRFRHCHAPISSACYARAHLEDKTSSSWICVPRNDDEVGRSARASPLAKLTCTDRTRADDPANQNVSVTCRGPRGCRHTRADDPANRSVSVTCRPCRSPSNTPRSLMFGYLSAIHRLSPSMCARAR